ncbi:MAG: hypothetical protein A3G39_09010 [Deltaproteobacteria bacterium RIFCSPLOWO2_12_FULL_43_16]|nr:MAG: hypothetical protein A2Z89_08285 [Deltaproteobacteria bacterium GWA2_43_19]OGQ09089.1 MAG: hypothetical protein A3D30_08610 [Deltaproteobacteria bacterium RIFCSPHIGHO2_02_FULL_43_33]OGQ57636.1 MAG: hypothetical protein A3G39_09010 [Deltaproteobacteria bacterium RIFCSPLOWO2_12_FULL_43_16]
MRTIKRTVCSAFVLFILFSSDAVADLYQWQDEKGDIHVVDDMLLVPPQYKDKAKKLKARPSRQTPSPQQNVQPPVPPQTSSEQEELYGDYPLSWWKNEFSSKKNEISKLENTIKEQKNFIADYERGRRLYRLYSKEDTDKYETYKKELSDNENQLNKLKTDLDEFRRKAQIYGVPRAIRE